VLVPAGTVEGPARFSAITVAGTVNGTDTETTELATEVAVIVTARSAAGVAAGAVYVAAVPLAVLSGDTVPHGGGAHETLHLTPPLVESPTTVAVIGVDVPAGTTAPFGDIDITMLEMVTVTLAETAGLIPDLAVMVTVRGAAGAAAGAV
jgi:hypothetical protein